MDVQIGYEDLPPLLMCEKCRSNGGWIVPAYWAYKPYRCDHKNVGTTPTFFGEEVLRLVKGHLRPSDLLKD